MKEATLQVSCAELEEMLLAANELSESLFAAGYDGKAKYILHADKTRTEGENAAEFVERYADITGAALRLIASVTGVIAGGIVNGELHIAAGEAERQ